MSPSGDSESIRVTVLPKSTNASRTGRDGYVIPSEYVYPVEP